MTHDPSPALSAIVGAAHVRPAGPDHDGCVVVLPACTAQVAAVMTLCATNGIALVPQGGGTGLVDGCRTVPGQVVLSLTRMAAIEAIYSDERVAVVQAGTPLQMLQDAAARHGLDAGIDLPSRGTATIGGMVATNAGGIMAHRHGVMRHRVLGLEAVLPDGTIYSDMTRVMKNTAGFDLKHLFIGAEGTLGIVTRVVLRLEPLPQATATALLGLPSMDAALRAITLAMHPKAGHLRAAEGMWNSFLRLTATAQGWSVPDFAPDAPVSLLLMLGGDDPAALAHAIEDIFAAVLDDHPDTTGIIASSARQEAELWRLREDTDLLYRAHPAAPSYDVSVPLSQIGTYVDHLQRGLADLDGDLAPYVFGHLADGNLHILLNRAGPLDPALSAAVEHVLYNPLRAMGGSFSAEHGVGAKRTHALAAHSDAGKLSLMRRIKHHLDPAALMNPGKVLPPTQCEDHP